MAELRGPVLRSMVAVGRVTPTSVRLWMRGELPGPHRLVLWEQESGRPAGEAHLDAPAETDGTAAITYPDEAGSATGLVPLTRYGFRFIDASSGRVVGEGSFRTAPAPGQEVGARYCFGLMSCHQPFLEDGSIDPGALQMLRAAREVLVEHDAALLFAVGDQMYSDYPERLSLFDHDYTAQHAPPGREGLFDCSRQEVRRIFHDRYQRFWGLPEWQTLLANIPCYPMIDDHEIIDNWGADPEHATPGWQTVGAGALDAYRDYQAARMASRLHSGRGSLHYTFEYGSVAGFVCDVRSERQVVPAQQIMSEPQFADLERFLGAHTRNPFLFVILTVPLVHVPRWSSRLGAWLTPRRGDDFEDRWTHPTRVRDHDRLVRLLHAHQRRAPHQRLVLLSGDIHVGHASAVCWRDSGLRLYQLTSSAITNDETLFVEAAASLAPHTQREVATSDGAIVGDVQRVASNGSSADTPYSDLNMGLVEVDGSGPEPRLVLKLYGHTNGRPKCVLHTEPL